MGYGLRFFELDDEIVGFCKKRHLSPKGNKNTITYSASELKVVFYNGAKSTETNHFG